MEYPLNLLQKFVKREVQMTINELEKIKSKAKNMGESSKRNKETKRETDGIRGLLEYEAEEVASATKKTGLPGILLSGDHKILWKVALQSPRHTNIKVRECIKSIEVVICAKSPMKLD